jgi:hypothetical protein
LIGLHFDSFNEVEEGVVVSMTNTMSARISSQPFSVVVSAIVEVEAAAVVVVGAAVVVVVVDTADVVVVVGEVVVMVVSAVLQALVVLSNSQVASARQSFADNCSHSPRTERPHDASTAKVDSRAVVVGRGITKRPLHRLDAHTPDTQA